MAFTSQAIRAAAIRVPGSKSLSNRHLILAALARGSTRLRGLLACDDCDRLLAALDACAISHRVDGGDLIIDGGADRSERDTTVNLGDGGTPTRFMLAFAAAQRGGACIIDASARMRERPVAEGVAMLRALGGEIHAENHGENQGMAESMRLPMRLPMRVRGGSLRGGRIDIGATASSQFVRADARRARARRRHRHPFHRRADQRVLPRTFARRPRRRRRELRSRSPSRAAQRGERWRRTRAHYHCAATDRRWHHRHRARCIERGVSRCCGGSLRIHRDA